MGYSPQDCKELDTTERLTFSLYNSEDCFFFFLAERKRDFNMHICIFFSLFKQARFGKVEICLEV